MGVDPWSRRVSRLVLLLTLSGVVGAQQLSPGASISVLTVAPGDQVHALFGHTAVRVSDPARGMDLVFNYGSFDFGPDFIPRFVYGQLDYFLSVSTYADSLEMWRWEERSVWAQELSLNPSQAQALFGFLAENARPENRVYRYDFLLDNCSTRVRDALPSALGAAIRLPPPSDPAPSFRATLDPYLERRPFLHFGIDVLMGVPVDAITRPEWQRWLPFDLRDALGGARLVDSGGSQRPLVSGTVTLFDTGRPPMPGPGVDWAEIVGWIVFALGIGNGARARRWVDGGLLLFAGVVGLLISLLWGVTLHHVTDLNLNLLWAWPTHAWVGWRVLRGRPPAWLRGYRLAAGVLALVTVLAWPWPWLPQRLPDAALPLALALGLGGLRGLKARVVVVRDSSG